MVKNSTVIKRLFAAFLGLILMIGLMPVSAMAEPAEGQADANNEAAVIIDLPALDETVYQPEEAAGEPLNTSAEPVEFDLMSDPFDFTSEEAREDLLHKSENYPSSFDLRNVDTDGDGEGDRCYVTPVKMQNPYGTCWGFAAITAAETSILGSLLSDDPEAYKTIDLSEKQLTYFSHMYLDDPADPQNGEGTHHFEISSASDIYGGGNPFMATATFAMGIGPVNESRGEEFIYKGAEGKTEQRLIDGEFQDFSYSIEDDWSLPEEDRFMQDYVLKESVIIPDPAGRDDNKQYVYNPAATAIIKEQLLNIRAVEVAFSADTSSPNQDLEEDGLYLSTKNWAHYTWDESASVNHAVAVIGWDDNYPKENFVEGHQPPEDGAWLVKNSWGSGEREFPHRRDGKWGIRVPKTDAEGNPVLDEEGNPVMTGSGYFWLSYYDKSLTMPEALVFDENKGDTKYYLDEYDLMQVNQFSGIEFPDETKTANIFKAEGCEALKAVSCQTVSPGAEITYEIYLLSSDYESPEDGFLMAEINETYEYGGFHKVWLDEPFIIQKGQAFSIVVTQKQDNGQYTVGMPWAFGEETPMSILSEMYQVGVVNPGESFVYTGGTWHDFAEQSFHNEFIKVIEDQYPLPGLQYDNFAIKGFSSMMPNDINIRFSGSKTLYLIEGEDSETVSLRFTGDGGNPLGNPAIEWKLEEGGEDYVTMTPRDGGAAVDFKALKVGKTHAAVTVEGVGTAVIPIIVGRLYPEFAAAGSCVYNGEPQEPTPLVLGGNMVLKRGIHYTATYSDNILCGAAMLTVEGIGEMANPAGPLIVYFPIKPAAAKINEVKADGTTLTVSVEDQKDSAITGYSLDYRKAGSSEWINRTFSAESADLVIDGLEANTEYEVRAAAYVDVPKERQSYSVTPVLTGDYSGIVTAVTGESSGQPSEGILRICGDNRFLTSLAIANKLKENLGVSEFKAVVLATGMNFPDALAGGYLANQKEAPIILISEGAENRAKVVDYIKANLAKDGGTIYVLGSEGAVKEAWLEPLKDFTIKRLEGSDRYLTNIAILNEIGVKAGDDILVATGANYADALSASGVAMPILLVSKELKADSQVPYLDSLKGSKFHILGAEAAVAGSIEDALKAYGDVDRVAGDSRYATSTAIAEKFVADPKGVALAYGMNFPDGLCGGPLAIRSGHPLILANNPDTARAAAAEYAKAHSLTSGVVFGSADVLTDDTVRAIAGNEASITEFKY